MYISKRNTRHESSADPMLIFWLLNSATAIGSEEISGLYSILKAINLYALCIYLRYNNVLSEICGYHTEMLILKKGSLAISIMSMKPTLCIQIHVIITYVYK